MSGFDVIDLSKLPPPKVIEELSYETIFQSYLAEFLKRDPDYDALLESDPAIVVLQAAAYRETILRARINDAAKATMLAYATGSDLDQLAADFNIERLEGESDDRLRLRRQLALEGMTTAGPVGAYVFHAMGASAKIKSVKVKSPEPGVVQASVLSTDEDGTADAELLASVSAKLNRDDVRPLTDKVVVRSAKIIFYEVEADVHVYPGPSEIVVEDALKRKLADYLSKRHVIGEVVAISGIYESLHVEGVRKIDLISPTADIITSDTEAAFCTKTTVKMIPYNE